MSSVEGKPDDDDDDDDICPSYSRNHTLCIQYLSSLVRSIHSRTVASFLNLHFIREELYNWSDGAQKTTLWRYISSRIFENVIAK